MAESSITRTDNTAVAIRQGQWFTIVWTAIEVAVAFIAAIRAHSVALAAFGGDSAIELLSAPSKSLQELHDLIKSGTGIDPLKSFSDATREELRAFTSQ
jgi:hypothetical protein